MTISIAKAEFCRVAAYDKAPPRAPTNGLPDDGMINRGDPKAMLAWARIFGVHHAQILIAVAVVGPVHDAVRNYLLTSTTCFRPGN